MNVGKAFVVELSAPILQDLTGVSVLVATHSRTGIALVRC